MANLSKYLDYEKINSMLNKVKNTVMQYTEFEIKTREATNNDKWGTATSTLMEIANATNNYSHFHHIMNTLYKRLQEPPADTWRQTYKLLEFLLLNGSEQCIDSARRRQYEVKALENYRHMDDKHKDQGINIRHRAAKIIELLSKDEMIRFEREKAKENKSKYTGISSSNNQSNHSGSHGSGFGQSDSINYPGNNYDAFGSNTDHRTSDSSLRNGNEYVDVSSRNSLHDRYHLPKSEQSDPPQAIETRTIIEPEIVDLLNFNPTIEPRSNKFLDDDFADFVTVPASQSNNPGFIDTKQLPLNSLSTLKFMAPPQTSESIGFAHFQPPISIKSTLANNDCTPLFGNSLPGTNYKHASPTTEAIQFSEFQSSNHNDPLSSLVSLDAFSLRGSGVKKEVVGISLNALGDNNTRAKPLY